MCELCGRRPYTGILGAIPFLGEAGPKAKYDPKRHKPRRIGKVCPPCTLRAAQLNWHTS